MRGFGGIVLGVMVALLLAASYASWIRTKFVDEQMAHLVRDREDMIEREVQLREYLNEIHAKLEMCRGLKLLQCQALLGSEVVVMPSAEGFVALFPYTVRRYVGRALLVIPAGTVVK